MITAPTPHLTERDHAILFGLARQAGLHTAAYCRELHDKLSRAIVIPLDHVEPDLVTIGSFVRYRVNGGRPMEHKVMLGSRHGQEQLTLSVKTLRGLALIGMSEGHIFSTMHPGDVQEVMEIEMIMFQPEADGDATRPGSWLGGDPGQDKEHV